MTRHMYRGGKASLLTSLDEISSAIGFGTAMYYRFLKYNTHTQEHTWPNYYVIALHTAVS